MGTVPGCPLGGSSCAAILVIDAHNLRSCAGGLMKLHVKYVFVHDDSLQNFSLNAFCVILTDFQHVCLCVFVCV